MTTGVDVYLLAALGLVLIILLWLECRPKRVYFIRHGRTLLNEQGIKQGEDGGLANAGKEQARRVGAALIECGISLICTSPYTRARETATIVNEYLHKPIRVTPLLSERRNPSEVVGKPVDDVAVKRVMGLTAYGYHPDSYRYADEENFEDLKVRAKKCLGYLEGRSAKNICAVTHHAFLHMLLSYMTVGDALHADDYVKLSFFNPAENGGITVCTYEPVKRFTSSRGWSVEVYNALAQEPATSKTS